MKDAAKERFENLAKAFLEPFANKADHEEAGDDEDTDSDWDKPMGDAVDSVETVKTLCFAVEKHITTYIEFWFGSTDCNSQTFMRAILYSNYGDEITRLRKHKYSRDKGVKLYEKYAKYLED